MSWEERYARLEELGAALPRHRQELISLAARELWFPRRDSAYELELTVEGLAGLANSREVLEKRWPLGGPDSLVAVILSYNGSAWLNLVIASTFLAGNRVVAKFSSRGRGLQSLMEEIYRPIFGDAVLFYRGSGRSLVEEVIRNPRFAGLVFFGYDGHLLPYQEAFRQSGKKVVFEGPGADPFIVFPDADLELALTDLIAAKFAYSGQTCTAPKRIFIHRDIYELFLKMVVEEVQRLTVGDPEDEAVQVTPLASDLAVVRIREALAEVAAKGAKILAGGGIEGNLVRPTVVRDAKDDMLGMREEIFGPVLFTTAFDTAEEVLSRARNHKYGLRAAVFGGMEAARTAAALKGQDYCHPVPDYTFGRFGTVSLNEARAVSWRGALVTKAVGGYGYSGWIWETVAGCFRLKQGPKLIHLETSLSEEEL